MAKTRFFYAKLGQANSLAADCLMGRTPIGQAAVPIFFDMTHPDKDNFLSSGSGKEQTKNFFYCSDHPAECLVISLFEGRMYVLQPLAQPVVFWKCTEEYGYAKRGDYVKFLAVKVVADFAFPNIPLILSSMSASAYFYTGTFREISDAGNVVALKCLLGDCDDDINLDAQGLIRCLSSIELETLVAKIFEAAGCFVPAYMGGVLRDIDIIAKNTTDKDITVFDCLVKGGGAVSVQVKRTSQLTQPPRGCDYLLVGDRHANALLAEVRRHPSTDRWFSNLVSWLPRDTLEAHGLAQS